MSLRRPRSHRIGISNIDFRTKRDTENLNIFEPWKGQKDLGTMGYKNYKNPQTIFKKLFGPSEKINTYRDLVNDYPDPRFHTTAEFYKKNNIKLNTKTFINTERVANLDETFKGKEAFNGDSTNIAEIMKKRKGKKYDNKNLIRNYKEPFSVEERKIQEEKIEKLTEEKKSVNKNVIQETQLVKINTFIDKGNNTINMKKIEEIRKALRRRYGNRKKINKIFQQWAKTFPNKITSYDAYRMINSLSIPINYNETKAFIASGSNTGNEYLTLEEFSNLIHDPTNIYYDNNNKYLYEEKEENDIFEKIIGNNKNQVKDKNILKLKNFISDRLYVLKKNIRELNKEKYSFVITNENKHDLNKIDYNKFKKSILSLRPSGNIGKEEYIKKIFDEFKEKDDLIDINYFCENITEKSSKEFMTLMKERVLQISKEQYEEKKVKLQNYINENEKNILPLFYQKKTDLDSQILEKKKIFENQIKNNQLNAYENQVNSTIPSTKWLHHIYDNRNEHQKILNRAEQALSAKPGLKYNKLKHNTRFSAVPIWRNTSEILIGDEKCCTYITEKERFNIDRDVCKEDKLKINLKKIGRENRIRTAIQKYENYNFMKQFLKEEKNIFSDMEKCKRLSKYDEISKNRNFLVE